MLVDALSGKTLTGDVLLLLVWKRDNWIEMFKVSQQSCLTIDF